MGSHYDGTDREVLALSAFINLIRAAETLMLDQSHEVAADGLTISQFGVLEALLHLGPVHQKDLGEKLLKTSGNITMVVDNLERRKLVERRRGTNDRRFVTVHLTPAGRRLIRRVMPRVVDCISNDLDRLTPDEQSTLRRLCRKLGKPEEERT